jgi:hypothetical protein
MFDTDVLLGQLANLGKQLDDAVDELGKLDMLATGHGCHHAKLREEHEDALATAFLSVPGSVEVRKNEARLKCVPSRIVAWEQAKEWEEAKSRVRTQQEAIRVLHRRVEIGRSLLSTEKTRMDLDRTS